MKDLWVNAINIGDPKYEEFTFHLKIGDKQIDTLITYEEIMALGTKFKKLKSAIKFDRWKIMQEKKNVSK